MGLDALLRTGPAPIDGGLASELEARGHDLSGRLWSARLLSDDPDEIRAVHAAYFAAGAQVAISASYQASRLAMGLAGLDVTAADELLVRSVELARQARDEAAPHAAAELLVAASVGPYGAALADGSEYRGNYGLPYDELVSFHAERLQALAGAAPDLFAIETIPDAFEAGAVVEALAAHPDIPAWLTFSCRDGATTCGGDAFEDAVAVASAAPSVRAVGVNCTAPEYVADLLAAGRRVTDLPFVVYPNAGRTWDAGARTWSAGGTDVLAEAAVLAWTDAGAMLIGGCCGLGPATIRSISSTLAQPRTPRIRGVAGSVRG